ncbi:MAG: vitamin K epoxide reductase family protein [Actinomycetota bacterium]
MRGDIPPGWDENPTARPKRLAIAAVAFAGLCVAGYLTLYQLGVLGGVWEPFFPGGSREVLTLFEPFPDAALGTLAYGAEILLSLTGGDDKWRTMPWTAVLFGGVIFSGALVSVALMIIQPVVAGAWCTLCLVSAGISLVICGWGADEPLAALQHVLRARSSGVSIWCVLLGRGGVN